MVALAPNDHVLCLQCEVPGRRTGQIKQALPFVVEEFLATDIEDLHIGAWAGAERGAGALLPGRQNHPGGLAGLSGLSRVGAATLGGRIRTAAISPGLRQHSVRWTPSPSFAAAAKRPNVERTGLGLALSALNVGAVRCLNGALTEAERGRFAGHVEEAETAAEAATENGFNLSVIDYLAERWALRDDAINLLQDAYKPAPAVPSETGKWRRSAVLTVLWLLLGMAGLAAKGWWSSSRADALEAQSLTLYRSIFPEDGSVTAQSLRRRLRSRLGAPTQSADASLVSLVGHLAAVLKPSMRVASIDYNRSRGEFNVDLLLKNYEDVEVLREALAAKAETEITSAEQVDEGVRARFRLRGV